MGPKPQKKSPTRSKSPKNKGDNLDGSYYSTALSEVCYILFNRYD